jgi:hypothetical protein
VVQSDNASEPGVDRACQGWSRTPGGGGGGAAGRASASSNSLAKPTDSSVLMT